MRLSNKALYIRREIIERNLEFCRAVTPEQMETILSLADGYDLRESDKRSLLVIKLENETAVPKVFYKDEVIELKQSVFFDWDTDTDVMGGLSYAIEHVVIGKGYPITNRIERRVKGHATT